ncbi:MAG: hypothetical protein CR993_02825 [Rhodobacterales bacterium]|nr:MAG: hypothetical protein CR993_02825 [Rhodobacterales bacterium]
MEDILKAARDLMGRYDPSGADAGQVAAAVSKQIAWLRARGAQVPQDILDFEARIEAGDEGDLFDNIPV